MYLALCSEINKKGPVLALEVTGFDDAKTTIKVLLFFCLFYYYVITIEIFFFKKKKLFRKCRKYTAV